MHEYGIAQELVSEVERTVTLHSAVRASRVVVAACVGALEEGALRAAFEEAKRSTVAADAELDVEQVAISACCLDCGRALSIDEPSDFTCPTCGSPAWRATDAMTVTLTSVELEV